MSSHGKQKIVEQGSKEKVHEDGGEKLGFRNKVKGMIKDVGEKIEEKVGFGKPTADVTAIHIPKINFKQADLIFDVLVTNPNPIPIPLVGINYLIESDGRKLISGVIPNAGTIHAHGSEKVQIPLCLIYDDIKNTYADIKPGSIIPYRLKVDLVVDVPVIGRLTLPLEKNGEIPIPKLDVSIDKIKFERFSLRFSSIHTRGIVRKLIARLTNKLAGMSSYDKPDIVERGSKDNKNEEGEDSGFLGKVKGFIKDVGEKIEETIGCGKPTADVSAIHIPKINLKEADIIVDVLVTNPNPVPIPLIDINYLIESDGRKLISGLIPDAGTIHAHGSETVQIPLCLIYDDIKNTYADIQPGSIIPYKIKVELIVDVPVFGRLTFPLEKCGEIPVPYKPDIDIEKIKFEKFSFEETVATLHLKLENKNDFDLGLNALDYEVWLCDVSIGGAELAKTQNLKKNGITDLEVPITFRPKDCGSALWDMIRGKGTGYSMKGNIDVDTPFGAMKLPLDKEGGIENA
ncbi:Immunoglobulin-like fold [Artemisia annua]|uniref:Immunoglobulin-like fold n=1 Tax=Artemisia annua TaxID=35608 RepID=A0A2U1M910_ARTAN|nr:Immunoglobulin-like fold [Artemisia annua]